MLSEESGGRDILLHSDDILSTVDSVTGKYKDFMELLLNTVSHVDRLEGTGKLSKEIAMKLGATGITARASGINDDIRKAHPHLLYDRLDFEAHTIVERRCTREDDNQGRGGGMLDIYY